MEIGYNMKINFINWKWEWKLYRHKNKLYIHFCDMYGMPRLRSVFNNTNNSYANNGYTQTI